MCLYSVVYATWPVPVQEQQKRIKTTLFPFNIAPVSGVVTRLSWVYDPVSSQINLRRPAWIPEERGQVNPNAPDAPQPLAAGALGQFDRALSRYKHWLSHRPVNDQADTAHFLLAGVTLDLAPPYQPPQSSTDTTHMGDTR
jgi:hypothetical protein